MLLAFVSGADFCFSPLFVLLVVAFFCFCLFFLVPFLLLLLFFFGLQASAVPNLEVMGA